MKSIFFKVRNRKNPIEITFEKKLGLYKPILKTPRKTYPIPLLLNNFQIEETFNKINEVKKRKKNLPNIEILKNIVAGAASITIKKGL